MSISRKHVDSRKDVLVVKFSGHAHLSRCVYEKPSPDDGRECSPRVIGPRGLDAIVPAIISPRLRLAGATARVQGV